MSADISIIIPVYNDPDGLQSTVESLLVQSIDRDYEIIIVDNDSTDATGDIAAEYAENEPLVKVGIENEIQGSYAARNRGLELATGSTIVFLDADVTADPGWLTGGMRAMESLDASYMGVKVKVVPVGEPPSVAEQYQMAKGFPVESYIRRDSFAPTCSLFVTRSLIDRVGNFDAGLVSGGDVEFGHRVGEHGFDLCYTDDIVSIHPARETVNELLEKNARVGRGKAQLRQRHPSVMSSVIHPRHFLPTGPKHFEDQLSDEYEWSRAKLSLFYLMNYMFKLRRTAAMLREYYRIS